MYKYITDKDFLKRMKSLCSDIINQLVQSINNDSLMEVEAHLVGSGAKNLITQNASEPIDLDYNLCILEVYGIKFNDGRTIKEYIRKHFNYVLNNNKWGEYCDCNDSKSVLSTKKKCFKKGNKTEFSIDLAIVRENNYGWERLIHDKTGCVANDRWFWNQLPDTRGLTDKVYAIKNENLWLEVREVYLEKKNMYLSKGDRNHPSFNVYIETINEIYYKYFGKSDFQCNIFSLYQLPHI